MTIKGLNWMFFGAAFAVSGCSTKSDDTGDGFEVGESEGEAAEGADDDSSDDADSAGGGDGSFDMDTMYVVWDGSYRDGAPVAGTYEDDAGETQVWENSFTFIMVDSADNDNMPEGNTDYRCQLSYDSTSAAVADFSDFDNADTVYMGFQMDLGAVTPEASGNCDGLAFALGIGSVDEFVEASPWGFGYGPMTDDFEDELNGLSGFDYASLGDQPGVSYLHWENSSGEAFTAWGFFQVLPFIGDDSLELNFPDGEGAVEWLGGVQDNPEPSDGLYYQTTIYAITFSAG